MPGERLPADAAIDPEPAPPGSGGAVPVVLVPGLLCDARLWSPVVARISAPTQVAEFGDAASLDAMADAILGAAPPRFVLAGFSMGGMAALLAAARAPDRLAALVIIATHAERDSLERAAARRRHVELAMANRFEEVVSELAAAYFLHAAASRAMRTLVADMAHAQGPEVFSRQVGAILGRPDLAAAAARIRTPTIVLIGENDRVVAPESARRLASLILESAFVTLPACGHIAPLEAPDKIVAFLEAYTRDIHV